MGAGTEVMDGMHAAQRHGCWPHVERCRCTFRMRGDTLITPVHSVVQVRISGQGRVRIGRSSRNGLNAGCHVKTPIRYPCRRFLLLTTMS